MLQTIPHFAVDYLAYYQNLLKNTKMSCFLFSDQNLLETSFCQVNLTFLKICSEWNYWRWKVWVFDWFFGRVHCFSANFFMSCRFVFWKRMEMLWRFCKIQGRFISFSKMQRSFCEIFHAGSLNFLNFIKNDPCMHLCACKISLHFQLG